jgi:23S rRNA (uridine2552-2'-O)-methyltransferase
VASRQTPRAPSHVKPAKTGGKPPRGVRPDGSVIKGNDRYDRHDTYYRKAKSEGFVARSIYKLDEIDRDMQIVRPNDRVLDLGCAPGSWLQYVETKIRARGSLVGIDLLPVKLSFGSHVRILQGDAFTTSVEELAGTEPGQPLRLFDVVLSDMAPNTTGTRSVDQARSMALCERALEVCDRALVVGGNFCVKVLEGGEMHAFVTQCREMFEVVRVRRPKGTRPGSTETYVVGMKKKRRSASDA